MATTNRPLLALAGLLGMAGVALAARGAHAGAAATATAAQFLLFHAPALLALALLASGRLLSIAGWVLALGLLLFAGDLVAHDMLGASPLPIAAPLGGGLLILGWLGIAASALVRGG